MLVVVAGLSLIVFGSTRPVSDAERAANAKTATSASDFSSVCKDGSVSNAAAFAKPYMIVAFQLAPSSLAFWDDYSS